MFYGTLKHNQNHPFLDQFSRVLIFSVPNIPELPENTTAITSSVQGTSMSKLMVTTPTLEKISLTTNRPNIINTLQSLGKGE